MNVLVLDGRTPFLSASSEAMRRQLQGAALTRAQATPLRDDVSTDEITPLLILTHHDDKLGRYPYTAFQADGTTPIVPTLSVPAASATTTEHYALPGQGVVGTDSYTPHSGALGCVAFGVGTTDMANALV